ncbi:hypothetical protein H4219_000378 [Mycoemilia scoparia]|uniref:3-hydroxyacyl-CoA dehydrogenase n=1 Tax=Mycoemilia scoparia TaxID=417184 RepID=A0A9W8DWW5_9FUNG|nr:hypothetical protein H4219_000378 [Mycoemilia scoparia]
MKSRRAQPKSKPSTPKRPSTPVREQFEQKPQSHFKNGITNLNEISKPFKNPHYNPKRRTKPVKQILMAEKALDWPVDFPTYWSIDAPPSLEPRKKYCDITGLEARYTDPKTNLRYHSAEVYSTIKRLPPGAEQSYLALRNANVVLSGRTAAQRIHKTLFAPRHQASISIRAIRAYASEAKNSDESSAPFSSVTVLGSGLMGSGIAQVAATANYKVNLVDLSEDLVQKGQSYIIKSLKRVAKKKFQGDEPRQSQFIDETLSRISLTTDTESAAAGADLIVEAIVEKVDTKQSVFSIFDKVAPSHTILTSNTSSLPIEAIGEKLSDKRKTQLAGLHFFNPVPQMKLVEIVRTDQTSQDTSDKLRGFVASLNKAPVMCKDTPGFIVNRLLVPYLVEAIRMLERGDATAQDIDTAMKFGAGYPMGPFELLDYVGLDTVKFILDGWYKEGKGLAGSDLAKPSEKLDSLVASGRLGVKSGGGFYDY